MHGNPFISSVNLRREAVPSFDVYPFNLPAVASLDELRLHPSVTFLVGENGSGKSTLLEGIAVGLDLNAEGGSRNFNFATRPSHSPLGDYLAFARGRRRPRDLWFLRAETFYNVATEIENLDAEPAKAPPISKSYGGGSLHERSHGESFYAIFQNRFGADGLYILDEPEAALSPMRQLGFISMLHDLVVAGSQFIIATHSPIIMAYPEAWIYLLGGKEIVRTPFKETEHFKVTRDFLNRPERMLSILMDQQRPGET